MTVCFSAVKPLSPSQAGDSDASPLVKNCTTDKAHDIAKTIRHWVGVANRRPRDCVIMIPKTIDSCVNTPGVLSGEKQRAVVGRTTPTDASADFLWRNLGEIQWRDT